MTYASASSTARSPSPPPGNTPTLLDHHRHPAVAPTTLYHQRWETETACLELKLTILGGRALRARAPDGIDQEIYALLVVRQLLRTAMADATSTQYGTDPDRASFSIVWQTARDLVIRPRASSPTRSSPTRSSTSSAPSDDMS